ncbi:hypothetical protein GCK72_015114 [Caenorhabditis remanei]|uniref:Uncharacterized protein n=1 Tax=Caenorhabditis remanei TaxID=31234 RepID=A0A6A5GVV8_CAERE|nr:hypothetical protein GCK72_015114 [Caenorhabditis remanei]KAF1758655.1 hypothetical protein GCK72_015114 [Caenorhabditis remanei]
MHPKWYPLEFGFLHTAHSFFSMKAADDVDVDVDGDASRVDDIVAGVAGGWIGVDDVEEDGVSNGYPVS